MTDPDAVYADITAECLRAVAPKPEPRPRPAGEVRGLAPQLEREPWVADPEQWALTMDGRRQWARTVSRNMTMPGHDRWAGLLGAWIVALVVGSALTVFAWTVVRALVREVAR